MVRPRSAESAPLPRRVKQAYQREVDRTHASLLAAAAAFAVTFGLLRALTHAIRAEALPWGNFTPAGLHIHHYVWGVAMLLVLGLINLIVDQPEHNVWLGAAYGVAAALIIDEYALLLNLRDVYWTGEGRISVYIALGIIAVSAIYAAATSFWRAVGREVWRSARRRRETGSRTGR